MLNERAALCHCPRMSSIQMNWRCRYRFGCHYQSKHLPAHRSLATERRSRVNPAQTTQFNDNRRRKLRKAKSKASCYSFHDKILSLHIIVCSFLILKMREKKNKIRIKDYFTHKFSLRSIHILIPSMYESISISFVVHKRIQPPSVLQRTSSSTAVPTASAPPRRNRGDRSLCRAKLSHSPGNATFDHIRRRREMIRTYKLTL